MNASPHPVGTSYFDAVVVGGGLTGLAAAVVVARVGLRTLHVAPKGFPDKRTSALMRPSIKFLEEAGLIDDPASLGHPLTAIRIIDATERLLRAPETLFESQEIGFDAFGWNIANVRLTAAFEAHAHLLPNLETSQASLEALEPGSDQKRLTLSDGTVVNAGLVVGADGKKSMVRQGAKIRTRERRFAQAALVCDLQLGRPLEGTSVEFHYAHGPFTLVPAGDKRANLVWIDNRNVLDAAQSGTQGTLQSALEARSMGLFGAIEIDSPAHIFPLSTLTVETAGTNGIVLVGEAAHAFPPIGAQGLNLGLRDVADLAKALDTRDVAGLDWAARLSTSYAKERAPDLGRTGAVVDALFRSLLAEMLPGQAMRAGGLWALKLMPMLRRRAFALGMGTR